MPSKFFLRLLLSTIAVATLPAIALPNSVYVSDTSRLGTVDLSTGAYHQIGPGFSDPSQGLAVASNGALLTMGFSGNLNSINPVTGVLTAIGPSGLSDCTTPESPCGRNSVNVLTNFNGQTLVTDFDNHIYTVNTATGAATFAAVTGLPAIPFIPLSVADGMLHVYDEALFQADGKLYATFDAANIDLSNGNPTPVIDGMLYLIDPATFHATAIGPTPFGLGAAAQIDGITYAFLDASHQLATLDLATGGTTVIGTFDEAAGIVSAAIPTPEPAAATIAGLGLFMVIASRWPKSRKRA